MPHFTPAERWNAGVPGYYRVTRPKALVVTHHGICRRDAYGQHVVLEINPTKTHLTDLATFADGQQISVLEWRPLSDGAEIEGRAYAVRARRRPYHLWQWNCEHLASEVFNGKPESAQADFGMIIGTILCIFAATAVVTAGSKR